MTIQNDELVHQTWAFSRENGEVIAPVVRLLPNGIVGGYIHPFERCWALVDGAISGGTIAGSTGVLPPPKGYLKRLRELPVRTVHGGHFASFSGERMRELIDAWFDAHRLT